MKKESRKGFTLVELFLVIIVLVGLAGTITISADESIASAEVNNIITNMRILKSAALQWLTDYGDFVDPYSHAVTYPFTYINIKSSETNVETIQGLMADSTPGSRSTMTKYIKMSSQLFSLSKGVLPDVDEYAITDGGNTREKWYVVYKFEKEDRRIKRIKRKMANKAQEFELYKNENDSYTEDSEYVYMKIIDLSKR